MTQYLLYFSHLSPAIKGPKVLRPIIFGPNERIDNAPQAWGTPQSNDIRRVCATEERLDVLVEILVFLFYLAIITEFYDKPLS
ncbi:MAG: hypothetical protein GWN30_05310, partial [Gammaproteobacteria bacterium]|nr:hypothetical protein [Gammaproteobacteria bacterium]NIX01263.1 hypothetical protein [Phycisphaerae bacterium]